MTDKVCICLYAKTTGDSDILKNTSCVLHKAGLATFEDRPIPTIGPNDTNETVLRIKYVGVCGSDVRRPTISCAAPNVAVD